MRELPGNAGHDAGLGHAHCLVDLSYVRQPEVASCSIFLLQNVLCTSLWCAHSCQAQCCPCPPLAAIQTSAPVASPLHMYGPSCLCTPDPLPHPHTYTLRSPPPPGEAVISAPYTPTPPHTHLGLNILWDGQPVQCPPHTSLPTRTYLNLHLLREGKPKQHLLCRERADDAALVVRY